MDWFGWFGDFWGALFGAFSSLFNGMFGWWG